jgi:hypothetical protein
MENTLNQLGESLDSIITCVVGIEERLRNNLYAKEKFISKKKDIVAWRLMNQAKELIESCNKYLALTNN